MRMLKLSDLRRRVTLGAALTALAAFATAYAGEGQHSQRVPLLPQYQQECAACHVAYPPGLLPAASWRRVMGSLSRHYGADASLDPVTAKELTAWLAANAGSSRRGRDEPPQDRITQSAWFLREHDEVPARTWKLPAVKSPSNCVACHARAEQGDFNEHNVRIPR
jgi:hypothetical protein